MVYKKSLMQIIIQKMRRNNRLQPNFFEVTRKRCTNKCFIKLIKNNDCCYYKNILKIKLLKINFFEDKLKLFIPFLFF